MSLAAVLELVGTAASMASGGAAFAVPGTVPQLARYQSKRSRKCSSSSLGVSVTGVCAWWAVLDELAIT